MVIQPVTQPLAEQFKVKVHNGVLVTEVRPNTPAAKAGVKPGDIILQFAGKAVSSPRELQGLVERAKIGSTLPLAVLRDGKQMTLNVTCRELPGDLALAGNATHESGNAEPSHFDKLGIQVEDLTPRDCRAIGRQGGTRRGDHGRAARQPGRDGRPLYRHGDHRGQPPAREDGRRFPQGAGAIARWTRACCCWSAPTEGSRFVVIRVESK